MKNLAHTLRLAAASLLILSACAGARQSGGPAVEAPTATVALWQQIQAANTDLGCDTDSQCHTIGVGAKACGGPENYVAWSSKNSNGTQLKTLVEKHAAARRDEDNKQGIMSTCTVMRDPGASCRANRCALNSPATVAPPGSQ